MNYAEQLQAMYLDWWNNYLTVEAFADAHQLTYAQARELIPLIRDIHNYIAENKTKTL